MVSKIIKGVVIGSAIGAVVMAAECGMKSKSCMKIGKRMMKKIGL